MQWRLLVSMLSLACLACPATQAQVPPQPSPGIDQVAQAGRLWARLQWVHPALASGTIDWDQALLQALPALRSAGSADDFQAALRTMLEPLHDPGLLLGPRIKPTYVHADPGEPPIEWLADGVALFNLHRPISAWNPEFSDSVVKFEEAARTARGVVVDLRPAEETFEDAEDTLRQVLPGLVTQTIQWPSQRTLFRYGYPPQTGSTSGGYFAAWMVPSTRTLDPAPHAHAAPLAFVVNEWTSIPLVILAMQRAGLAYIVSENAPKTSWGVPTETMAIADGLQVTFSAGELIYSDGTTGFGADGVVQPSPAVGPDSPAVRAALALVKSGQVPGRAVAWKALPLVARWAPDPRHATQGLPDLPLRQLAVIRLWTVMDTFFPYKDLMDRPWADALPEFLERMEHVTDERSYAGVIAEMATRLQDNHVRVSGGAADQLVGEAGLPLTFAMVEGRVVVSRLRDEHAASGIHPWDEVLELDGQPVGQVLDRLADIQPAANTWTRDRNVLGRAFGRGADGSTATLTIRDDQGRVRTIALVRAKAYATGDYRHRDGEVVRILPGNIGYADLDRLTRDQVDHLFDTVQGTRALILDMRGYPNGTAWSIAPRLNVKGARPGPLFSPNLVIGGGDEMLSPHATWVQALPRGDGKPLYRGKVLMLINEQTQSQAEHTGLMIEAACDLTYVGSASAGSNGDVTNVVLPGNLTVQFTGQGVRHPDGRQLQRIGLKPDLPVEPTLNGLRSGRDEVLERAVRWITTGR